MSGLTVSAIVIAKNEEATLARCLSSLAWLPEVVVVIDEKTIDRSREIAHSFENCRVIESPWLGFSATKQLAVQHTSHPWILWIDADEVVPDALKTEISEVFLKDDPRERAFDFPRRNFFLGKWIRGCDWYPGRVLRLFHKEFGKFNDRILHEGVEVTAKVAVGHLVSDLDHYSYVSLRQYFDKMNSYGLPGAQELMRRGRRFHYHDLVLRPLFGFFRSYFLKRGFLDGSYGFVISLGNAFSYFIRYANFMILEQERQSARRPSHD